MVAAEVAFLVEEDYQGCGIASTLLAPLTHLTICARDHGIVRFDAEAPTRNRSMLDVFARSGLPMQRQVAGGVVELSLAL